MDHRRIPNRSHDLPNQNHLLRLSSLFLLKHGTVRVHDQHDLGDDEDEDEDKDQPADWWMAVARRGVQKLVTKIFGHPF
jgi:hypothetical protein